MKVLYIVVPCYNEEEVLPDSFAQLSGTIAALEAAGTVKKGRILFVDDGSTDSTWNLISAFAGQAPSTVCGLKISHNSGHQHALWAGMEYAVKYADAVVTIDADMQDDVMAVVEMVDKYRNGADIVYGVRKKRETDTVFKRNTAQCYYKLMKSAGVDLVYNHADYRLMGRRVLKLLLSFPEKNIFIRGLVKSLGFKQDYVYYNRKERQAGVSKYSFLKMLNFAWDGITSFTSVPLHAIMFVGLFFILISFCILIYCIVLFFMDHVLPGWASLIISIWFVGGTVLVALGVIGEYVGKAYKEVKNRPGYLIEEIIDSECLPARE